MTTKTAPTRQLSPTHFQAKSSNGSTVYDVLLTDRGTSCTCPAGSNGRRCYHVASVVSKHAVFAPAPWARRFPPAQVSDLYA